MCHEGLSTAETDSSHIPGFMLRLGELLPPVSPGTFVEGVEDAAGVQEFVVCVFVVDV